MARARSMPSFINARPMPAPRRSSATASGPSSSVAGPCSPTWMRQKLMQPTMPRPGSIATWESPSTRLHPRAGGRMSSPGARGRRRHQAATRFQSCVRVLPVSGRICRSSRGATRMQKIRRIAPVFTSAFWNLARWAGAMARRRQTCAAAASSEAKGRERRHGEPCIDPSAL